MVGRTDEERLTRAPFKLQFGDMVKEIRPLVLRDSKLWKEQVIGKIAELAATQINDVLAAGGGVLLDNLQPVLAVLAQRVPDEVERLIIGYLKLADPSIDPTWVHESASDEQISEALWTLITVTFPFFSRAGEIIALVRRAVRPAAPSVSAP